MESSMHPSMMLFHPSVIANPYQTYQQLRQEPVYHAPMLGSWLITGYKEVGEALRHEAMSTQIQPKDTTPPADPALGAQLYGIGQFLGQWLVFTDPPHHRPLRAMMNEGFRARLMEQMRGVIYQLVDELLDKVEAQGEMCGVADLGYPLALTVITRLLGIPEEDQHLAKKWTAQTFAFLGNQGAGDAEAIKAMADVVEEVRQYFTGMLAARKEQPRKDFLTDLLSAMTDEKLTEEAVLANALLLFIAGQDTTVNAVGNCIAALAANTQAREQLIADPSLIPNAVEELLRYDSPTQFLLRSTTAEVTLGGKTIPAGERIMIFVGSANRDETIFKDPDSLDLQRNPNPHMAFGHGLHHCLGTALARIELSAVLERLNQRFPAWYQEGEAVRRDIVSLRGYQSLPLKLVDA